MNEHHRTALTDRILKAILDEGFAVAGIAQAKSHPEDTEHLNAWIAEGRHSKLGYLVRGSRKIGNICSLVDGAASVIVAGLPYRRDDQPVNETDLFFSRYTRVKDYHMVITKKLERVARMIEKEVPGSSSGIFCDAAPITEKEWAIRAGIGWRGKQSVIINEKLGSFFFLGEIITTVPLVYNNTIIPDHCGTCRRCVEACPTGAICDDRTIDTRRCISYMTIESFENIPEWFGGKMENMIYGCDRCQEVCPWNNKPALTIDNELIPDTDITSITKEQWLTMTEDEFASLFATSAVRRAGLKKIRKSIFFVSSSRSPEQS